MNKPENNLKPCPFCGGTPFVATVEHSEESRPNDYRFHGRVMCRNCQASAGTTGFDKTYEEATEKAVKRWNNRQDNRLLLDVARAAADLMDAQQDMLNACDSDIFNSACNRRDDAMVKLDAALARAKEAGVILDDNA